MDYLKFNFNVNEGTIIIYEALVNKALWACEYVIASGEK